MNKICLIGFMGCGKTTVGMALAHKLQWEWTDLDAYIVEKAGKPISDIFAEEGEVAFRTLEADCLEEILNKKDKIVLSTGGGVITTPINRQRLQQTETIFLDYPFEVLFERIKGDASRPLVTTYEDLHKRYLARQSFYKSACSKQVACAGMSVEEIVETIIEHIAE